MAQPSNLPEFNTNETNSTEYPQTYKDDGFPAPGGIPVKPKLVYFHYWMNLVYKWIKHLFEKTQVVDSIADLQAPSYTPFDGQVVQVLGYSTPGDGGGGEFYWDDTSVETENIVTIVKVDSIATGRFYRKDLSLLTSIMAGMDPTGVTDDTTKFATLLAVTVPGVRNILLTDGNYSVKGWNGAIRPMIVKSNTRLEFSKDAWLISLDSGNDISSVLEIVSVSNIEIINPQIVGDVTLNALLTEGAGHCIDVRSVDNIKVYGGKVSGAYTDALYLNNVTNCEVAFGDYYDNGRQGISLISGDNVYIHDLKARGSFKNAPMFGIDIEPNGTDTILKNIRLKNIETSDNTGAGIGMNIHGTDIDVDVLIENHVDVGSTYGASFSSFHGTSYTFDVAPGSKVVYRNGKSIDALYAGIVCIWNVDNSPHLRIEDPYVHNCNRSGGTNQRVQEVAISLHNESSGYLTGRKLGNLEIIRPRITMESTNSILRGMYLGYTDGASNIKIIDPVEISIGNDSTLSTGIGHDLISFVGTTDLETVTVTDAYDVLNATNSASLIRNFDSSVYSNIISEYTGSAVSVTTFLKFGVKKRLRIQKANGTNVMTVTLPSSITFIDSTGAVVSTSAVSSTANAVLRFERISSSVYLVIGERGVWTIT